MSSRLFNEIREKKGLAYEIATHAKKLKDCGIFFVHAGIDNKNLIGASKLIFKELDKIRSKKVSKGELRRAKDFLTAQAEMALDDTMEHMLWMGESLLNLGYLQTKEEMRRMFFIRRTFVPFPPQVRHAAAGKAREELVHERQAIALVLAKE